MPDDRLVAVLRDLEARVLRAPTGVQDYWSAITGGVTAIHLEPGGERVERIEVEPSWISDRITVFDTGIAHHSGMVNWQVIRRRLEGASATAEALEAIARAAAECRSALLSRDGDGVGRAIEAEWAHRQQLAPEVCPPELLEIERAVMAAGALAFKACGAGGGGSVIVWHGPGARAGIRSALERSAPAGRIVATEIVTAGCRVECS
jgi:D-glycero-alpha-D-manno-heptose-7-phosphate kinase